MTAAGEDVAELPGIGQDLADKIETLADTGHLAVVDEIEAHTPAGPTDAHSASELGFIRYAVDQARRGWLEPEDIINPRGLDELRASLRRP